MTLKGKMLFGALLAALAAGAYELLLTREAKRQLHDSLHSVSASLHSISSQMEDLKKDYADEGQRELHRRHIEEQWASMGF